MPAYPVDGDDPRACGLLTVIVHGFENTATDATNQWRHDIWPGVKDQINPRTSNIMVFMWPSDSIIRDFGAHYPGRVETAISAGVELAKYLQRISGKRNPELKVQFVGHSLGCRVVLSAVEQLAKSPQEVPVVGLLLMGAAVPVADCANEGRWPDKVSKLFREAHGQKVSENSDVVLYSGNDRVLGMLFPVGERLARRQHPESSGSFEAVGLNGGPGQIRWTEKIDSCGIKHTRYMSNPTALRYVAALLGQLIDRQLAERPECQRSLGERQPDQRHLPSRLPHWARLLS